MILIDEREYDRLNRPLTIKNELGWKRPIETRAKNDENRNIKSILDDDTLPDDLKSKTYNQTLTRFRNTKTKIENRDDNDLIDIFGDSQPDTHQIQVLKPRPADAKKKRRTIKTPAIPYSPIRTRKRKPVKRFDATKWIEY